MYASRESIVRCIVQQNGIFFSLHLMCVSPEIALYLALQLAFSHRRRSMLQEKYEQHLQCFQRAWPAISVCTLILRDGNRTPSHDSFLNRSVPRLPARFFIPRHRSPIAKQMGEQENNTTQGQSKVSRGTLASSMIRDWIRGELDPPPIAILPRYQERHGHTWSTEAVAGHVTLPHAFGDESMATFSSGPKPELDDADVGARLDDGDLGSLESNGESSIISSKIFSRVTSEQPTTAPTSFLPNKRTAAPVVNDTNNVDAMSAENAAGSANILTAEYDLNLDSQARVEVNSSADWPDVATDYSRASTMSHSDPYIQAFYEVLFRDMHRLFDDQNLHSIDAEQLDAILKTFALKLHGESANPFERDASVTLHRQRR